MPLDSMDQSSVDGIASDRLLSIVQRYENLDEEKKAITDGQKDVMTEAKSSGFDVKALRAILKLRKMDPAEAQEQEALIDVYKRALGMR